jgi:hypothetical protein
LGCGFFHGSRFFWLAYSKVDVHNHYFSFSITIYEEEAFFRGEPIC